MPANIVIFRERKCVWIKQLWMPQRNSRRRCIITKRCVYIYYQFDLVIQQSLFTIKENAITVNVLWYGAGHAPARDLPNSQDRWHGELLWGAFLQRYQSFIQSLYNLATPSCPRKERGGCLCLCSARTVLCSHCFDDLQFLHIHMCFSLYCVCCD